MRWARRGSLLFWLALVAVAVAAPPAAAQSASDVLLEHVGSGFQRGPDQGGALESVTRTFVHPHGQLQLQATAVAAGMDVRDIFSIFANADVPSLVAVDVPGLPLARWFVVDGVDPERSPLTFVAFASRQHVFTALLTVDGSGEIAPVPLLLDVASRQIERAGGPPTDTTPRTEDPKATALTAYLPDQPASRFGLGASATMTGQDELSPQVGIDPEVVAFLNGRSHTVARVWANADSGLSGAVSVTDYPYGIFAAAALGASRDTHDIAPRRLLGLEDVPDVFTFLGDGPRAGQVGAALRRGRLSVLVLAQAADPQDLEQAAALVVDLTREAARRLPAGDSSPYRFPAPPSTIAGLALTAALVTAAGASAIGVGRARAWTLRRAGEREEPPLGQTFALAPGGTLPPPNVIPLDDDARGLRHRGAVVVVGQLIALNIIVVALAGDFGWPGVAVAACGLAGGLGFTSWWRRRELGALGPQGVGAPFVLPRPAGIVMGVVALAVLAIGVSYAFKGLRYLLLKPTLAQMHWSDLLGLPPRGVGVVFALGGLLVAALGAVLFRIARALGRADTRRLLAVDHRAPILYLRSFNDDTLPLATIASARRPFFELLSFRGRDPFEEAVAWELATYGPVVAVGKPGRSLASLGAAREHLSDDTWQVQVAQRMDAARAIAVATGETPGLHWEVEQIVTAGHLGKTMFVFPPVDADGLARRWGFTAAALAAAGAEVAPLPADPAVVHTAHVGTDGQVLVTVAERRDEASYRTAVDRAMAHFASAAAPPVVPSRD